MLLCRNRLTADGSAERDRRDDRDEMALPKEDGIARGDVNLWFNGLPHIYITIYIHTYLYIVAGDILEETIMCPIKYGDFLHFSPKTILKLVGPSKF